MLQEAGLGCGHPGEEEWDPSGALGCSMACWGLGLEHPLCRVRQLSLFMGSDRKWVSSSTPGQDGQGTRWGHDGASI